MERTDWQGVMPAITNPYESDLSIDHRRLAEHVTRMADAGSTAIVTPGSLGEGGALSLDEKVEIWTTCTRTLDGRIPVVAAVSAMSTAQSATIARAAEDAGCRGLMVLRRGGTSASTSTSIDLTERSKRERKASSGKQCHYDRRLRCRGLMIHQNISSYISTD